MSTEETFETLKKSRQKSIANSPMPADTIKLDFEDHMIGKRMITFENDDIILNGKKYKGTVGLWRLLAHSDITRPEYYTKDDFKIYKEIFIETDSMYQNDDKSTGRAKSSGGAKYISMISNIWKEIIEKKRPITKPIGEGLRQYTDDRIEYRYIDNMKQLTDRLQLIAAEERAGNNNYHNEKLGILHLCKTSMEKIIDTPKGPGTKLEKNKKPLNKLDEAARDHDYFYKDHKDTKTRHEADKILEQKAMERFNAPDTNMNKKIPALLTAYAMKSKRHLGMNLKKKLAEACKNNTKAIIQIASDKIYKGENIFYLAQNQIDKLKNKAAAVATPAIVALYDSYKDSKHKKKMEEETIRHNKEMEEK
ncbi:hypothetical protein AGLY_017022 [Aphis glycines]|uniref:Phospholipase A2-like domain-containing protein n=1 Tax=Aphis glycines TaxID=307491 RepID=A0A6G0SW33_APHGL|nr:hypothetical protein AGLY_017022 [Aphis glycines]